MAYAGYERFNLHVSSLTSACVREDMQILSSTLANWIASEFSHTTSHLYTTSWTRLTDITT